MCTRIAHSQGAVELCDREEHALPPYEKNAQKYIMAPANAIRRHPFVEERTKKLAQYGETSPLNRVEYGGTEKGIICSGTCYQYVKEVFGDSVSVLKLGLVNPLPTEIIRDFAAKVDKLYVIEELDGIIESHLNALKIPCVGKELFSPVGEYNQTTIRDAFGLPQPESVSADTPVPVRPPVMCAGCPHRGLFYTLSKHKITCLGDIGCYTLGSAAPLFALDSTLCMGASVSGLHGFNKAGGKDSENKTVCVIGDSTFMHSGVTGLINIAYNASNSTVIILDNSITGMTGHQQNPTTGYTIKGDPALAVDLEALCRSIGIERVRVVDPYNLKECEDVILEELAVDAPSVIISRRPCMLLKYVKAKPPVKVNEDKCVGCRRCMKLGCPAISMKNKKAHIDFTQCVGCDVCTQLCNLNAINMETKNVMIVGVGGQGSLLASKLLGKLLTQEGFDVKVSEVHGMSQRGGSVVTYVRFGDKVYSPVIAKGEADFIVSFEKIEAARYADILKKDGKIIVNSQMIDPMPVITGAAEYPVTVLDELRAKGVFVDEIDALAGRQRQEREHRPHGQTRQIFRYSLRQVG